MKFKAGKISKMKAAVLVAIMGIISATFIAKASAQIRIIEVVSMTYDSGSVLQSLSATESGDVLYFRLASKIGEMNRNESFSIHVKSWPALKSLILEARTITVKSGEQGFAYAENCMLAQGREISVNAMFTGQDAKNKWLCLSVYDEFNSSLDAGCTVAFPGFEDTWGRFILQVDKRFEIYENSKRSEVKMGSLKNV